jgi:hypothetical protein
VWCTQSFKKAGAGYNELRDLGQMLKRVKFSTRNRVKGRNTRDHVIHVSALEQGYWRTWDSASLVRVGASFVRGLSSASELKVHPRI